MQTIPTGKARQDGKRSNDAEKHEGQRGIRDGRTDNVNEAHPCPIGRQTELGSGDAGCESKRAETPEDFGKALTAGKNSPVDEVKKRTNEPERQGHDQRPLPHFGWGRMPVDVHGSVELGAGSCEPEETLSGERAPHSFTCRA